MSNLEEKLLAHQLARLERPSSPVPPCKPDRPLVPPQPLDYKTIPFPEPVSSVDLEKLAQPGDLIKSIKPISLIPSLEKRLTQSESELLEQVNDFIDINHQLCKELGFDFLDLTIALGKYRYKIPKLFAQKPHLITKFLNLKQKLVVMSTRLNDLKRQELANFKVGHVIKVYLGTLNATYQILEDFLTNTGLLVK